MLVFSPFLLSAPKENNLYGPISTFFSPSDRRRFHAHPHKCFAARVAHRILSALKDEDSPKCFTDCFVNPRDPQHFSLFSAPTPPADPEPELHHFEQSRFPSEFEDDDIDQVSLTSETC